MDRNTHDLFSRRIIATRLGFGGIVVVNVYAYRATDPRDLRRAGYLAGLANDEHIKTVLMERADRVICAWGSNAKGLSRPGEILKIIKACGHEPMALQVNAAAFRHTR
ncbi:DUF1643 domain-containing protein (plasmid) [Polaromonas sp. P1-6]|nr:DUF1643 domain-containing protein [Polaromonas sp. P1-6]